MSLIKEKVVSEKEVWPISRAKEGKYNTCTKRIIDLHNPTLDMIDIEDISCALSKMCRFGGMVEDFYSVSQHSVLVCGLCPDYLKGVGLAHDMSEAYLGDIITPLKEIIRPIYGPLEEKFTRLIFSKFNLDFGLLGASKEYDTMALDIEHKALQLGDFTDWDKAWKMLGYPYAKPWYVHYAQEVFMENFNKYVKNKKTLF